WSAAAPVRSGSGSSSARKSGSGLVLAGTGWLVATISCAWLVGRSRRRRPPNLHCPTTDNSDLGQQPWLVSLPTLCRGIGVFPGRSTDPDWQASLPPGARILFEQPRDRGAAGVAAAIGPEPPSRDLMPVAADDASTATRAIRALARFIMDVAGVDKAEAHVPGDITGHGQRARPCGAPGPHVVVS